MNFFSHFSSAATIKEMVYLDDLPFYHCYALRIYYEAGSAVEMGFKHNRIYPKKTWMNMYMKIFSFFSIPVWYKLFIYKPLELNFLSFPSQQSKVSFKSVWIREYNSSHENKKALNLLYHKHIFNKKWM